MLRVHQLNVGKGDSAVIELLPPTGGHYFGVVDSNLLPEQSTPAALTLLRQLKAEALKFVVLTHPHADHYSGLFKILEAYKGKIEYFLTFPVDKSTSKLDALMEIFKTIGAKLDSGHVAVRNLAELYRILMFGKLHLAAQWDDTSCGWDSRVFTVGGLSAFAVLPLKSKKGAFFQSIENGTYDPLMRGIHDNDLSVALRLEYGGREIVLGGDGTYAGWMDRKKAAERNNLKMKADVVKLPHHGSKYDCSAVVIDSLYRDEIEEQPRYAIISAEGRHHPANETLAALSERKILPFCTNLAKQCGAPMDAVVDIANLTPVAKRDILQLVDDSEHQAQTPCQGTVTLTIDASGNVKIDTEHKMLCPYHI